MSGLRDVWGRGPATVSILGAGSGKGPRFDAWRGTAILALLTCIGCATGPDGALRLIQFEAPSQPDAEMRLILREVDTLGVLSGTNIEPVQGLDIEKVTGRLTDAAARGLRNLQDRVIVTQDEIRWRFKDVVFDSAYVADPEARLSLHEEMGIDALIYVSLQRLQARMTPNSRVSYGSSTRMSSQPGMTVSVDLEVSLINLISGDVWRQHGQHANWKPVQVQLLGGNDRTEQQLLAALQIPLKQFLERVAPPPALQARRFDLSGD